MIWAKPIIGIALKSLNYMTGGECGECLGNYQVIVMQNNLIANEPGD